MKKNDFLEIYLKRIIKINEDYPLASLKINEDIKLSDIYSSIIIRNGISNFSSEKDYRWIWYQAPIGGGKSTILKMICLAYSYKYLAEEYGFKFNENERKAYEKTSAEESLPNIISQNRIPIYININELALQIEKSSRIDELKCKEKKLKEIVKYLEYNAVENASNAFEGNAKYVNFGADELQGFFCAKKEITDFLMYDKEYINNMFNNSLDKILLAITSVEELIKRTIENVINIEITVDEVKKIIPDIVLLIDGLEDSYVKTDVQKYSFIYFLENVYSFSFEKKIPVVFTCDPLLGVDLENQKSWFITSKIKKISEINYVSMMPVDSKRFSIFVNHWFSVVNKAGATMIDPEKDFIKPLHRFPIIMSSIDSPFYLVSLLELSIHDKSVFSSLTKILEKTLEKRLKIQNNLGYEYEDTIRIISKLSFIMTFKYELENFGINGYDNDNVNQIIKDIRKEDEKLFLGKLLNTDDEINLFVKYLKRCKLLDNNNNFSRTEYQLFFASYCLANHFLAFEDQEEKCLKYIFQNLDLEPSLDFIAKNYVILQDSYKTVLRYYNDIASKSQNSKRGFLRFILSLYQVQDIPFDIYFNLNEIYTEIARDSHCWILYDSKEIKEILDQSVKGKNGEFIESVINEYDHNVSYWVPYQGVKALFYCIWNCSVSEKGINNATKNLCTFFPEEIYKELIELYLNKESRKNKGHLQIVHKIIDQTEKDLEIDERIRKIGAFLIFLFNNEDTVIKYIRDLINEGSTRSSILALDTILMTLDTRAIIEYYGVDDRALGRRISTNKCDYNSYSDFTTTGILNNHSNEILQKKYYLCFEQIVGLLKEEEGYLLTKKWFTEKVFISELEYVFDIFKETNSIFDSKNRLSLSIRHLALYPYYFKDNYQIIAERRKKDSNNFKRYILDVLENMNDNSLYIVKDRGELIKYLYISKIAVLFGFIKANRYVLPNSILYRILGESSFMKKYRLLGLDKMI